MKKKKLLLHTCCAVCVSYPLEFLSEAFDISLFFYNPNIYPETEYFTRLADVKKFADFKKIHLFVPEYEESDFEDNIKGLENEPEGHKRCSVCYNLRLEKTAWFAKISDFQYFATTLTLSPHKDYKKINELGNIAASKFDINYFESNFKKKDGFKIANMIARKFGFYRQDYCGCRYSLGIKKHT